METLLVDAVLLRKLPVADRDRVVVVHNQMPKINLPRTQVSGPRYLDYSRQTDCNVPARRATKVDPLVALRSSNK